MRVLRASLVPPAPPSARELARNTGVPIGEVDQIAFASGQVGYGLGGPTGTTYPLKTTDGGRRWRVDGPAPFLPVADAPLGVGSITAVSTTEAYAFGGAAAGSTVDVTTDGGQQWWRASLGQGLPEVATIGSALWALAHGDTSSSSATAVPPVWLYVSSDGRRVWRYRSSLSGGAGWQSDLVRTSRTARLALVSELTGHNARSGGLVSTTDAGTSWRVERDPCGGAAPAGSSRTAATASSAGAAGSGQPTYTLQHLAAGSSVGTLWLVCGRAPFHSGSPSGGNVASNAQAKAIERSTDGGASWRLVSSNGPGEHVPPGAVPLSGTLPGAGTTGLSAVTPSGTAWLVLQNWSATDPRATRLFESTDGGHHWGEGAPKVVEAQDPGQVVSVGGSLLVLTRKALWKLQGGHWQLVAGT